VPAPLCGQAVTDPNEILRAPSGSSAADVAGPIRASLITRFITGLNALSGYIVFFMMIMITIDVTGRYLFNSPISGTLELTEFLMVFVVFFSMAYVQLNQRHIRVELLTQRLPKRVGDGFAIVTLLIAAVFFGLLAWQSWLSAWSAFEYREASEGLIQIPIYPPKFVIPFGSAIMVVQLLRDMAVRVRSLASTS